MKQTGAAQMCMKKPRCTNTMKWEKTKLFLSSMHSLALMKDILLIISQNYYTIAAFITSPFTSLSNYCAQVKCPKC
jgi:hypothetical protein